MSQIDWSQLFAQRKTVAKKFGGFVMEKYYLRRALVRALIFMPEMPGA